MIGIIYADYYLPHHKKRTEKYFYENKFDIDIDDFISTSGIEYIYITKSKNYISMIKSLLDDYFKCNKCNPEEFSYIIFTNLSNYLQDNINIPYLIQKDYGFKNASILYLNNACASCIQAIQVGSELIRESNEKILILAVTSNLEDQERFMNITITGDAAGIIILSDSADVQAQVVDSLSIADGSYSCGLYYEGYDDVDKLELLWGNIKALKAILIKNHISVNDIELIIPQNINIELYHLYAKSLNISYEKIFTDNISKGGHLENVDTIRNYLSCIESIKNNSYFIIMGLGLLNLDAMYNVILCKKVSAYKKE